MIYGINPDFHTWTGRHIVFSDAIKRGRKFEIFNESGMPTGGVAPLGPDGWPIGEDWHGVRIFGGMKGTVPTKLHTDSLVEIKGRGVTKVGAGLFEVDPAENDNGTIVAMWRGELKPSVRIDGEQTLPFYRDGIQVIRDFRPVALRTLNWTQANQIHRGDRVRLEDPLWGSLKGMPIEAQVMIANLCYASLFFNVPARLDRPVEEYRDYVRSILEVMAIHCKYPPVLEYSNETWNADFPVHVFARQDQTPERHWTKVIADEIKLLWEVADEVFGPQTMFRKPYFKFVGGFIQDPSILDKIIRELPEPPDFAGPACYIGPDRESVNTWNDQDYEPTQEEIEAACQTRLVQAAEKLYVTKRILTQLGVKHMVCYEAGQSMIAGFREKLRRAYQQSQREEWMGDLYRQMKGTMAANGVSAAMWFSLMGDQTPPAPVDPFGLLEGHELPLLPKAQAVLER